MPGPAIVIENFGGEVPILSVRDLPPNFAARAINVKLLSGELRGLRGLKLAHQFTPGSNFQKALHITYTDGAEHWIGLETHDADAARSQIVNDLYGRIYYLDAGLPYPAASAPVYNTKARLAANLPPLLLGVPAPINTLVVTPVGGDPASTQITRAYVITFVSDFGEESAPCLPTIVTGNATATPWTVSNMDIAVPAPYGALGTINTVRIYRTITGADGSTTYFKVTDVPLTTSTYNDVATDVDVLTTAIPLPSAAWDVPPDMQGFIQLPGGALMGWKDNQIYFSEPFLPHTWPPQYQVALESNIIGAGIFLNTVVFGTDGYPYVMTVTNPSNIDIQKINVSEPCLSKTSIVSALEGVYYASQNGLVVVNTTGLAVTTRTVISHQEWTTEYVPGTITAARYGTQYIGLSAPGEGFVFDSLDPRVSIVDLQGFQNAEFIWNDLTTGNVQIMADDGVYTWDSPDQPEVTYRWMSKEFVLPAPKNMGAGIVYLDTFAYANPTGLDDSYTPGEAPNKYTAPTTNISAGLHTVDADGLPVWTGSFVDDLTLPDNTLCFFRLYANRKLVYSMPIPANTMFRLPGGFKTDVYQIELLSRRRIFKTAIAETAKGLERV